MVHIFVFALDSQILLKGKNLFMIDGLVWSFKSVRQLRQVRQGIQARRARQARQVRQSKTCTSSGLFWSFQSVIFCYWWQS